MKKMRKGFTLVELLIVISIIGTLAATMSASVSGSTAKAKAAAIAHNVEACKDAAGLYYAAHMDDGTDLTTTTADDVLSEFVGTWKDFKNGTDITYTAVETGTNRTGWAVIVDFHTDADKDAIISALSGMKGFGKYDGNTSVVSTGKFKVLLWNGTITSETVSEG